MDETTSTRPSDAAPITVLLVEDDPEHAALVARRLSGPRSERFDLDRAASLDEALRKLAERKFDAALVDLSLPDSLGMGTVLAVKAEDPELAVIVMTASDDESLELSALRAGAQDYIVKGDDYRPTLRSAIQHAVERQSGLIARQRAEAALKLSEATFRTLIESTPDAIFVHRDGFLLYLNPAARELLSVASASELIGKAVTDVVLREDVAILGELMQQVESNGGVNASCELRFCRTDDAEVRLAIVAALAVQFDGEPATLMVARDITDQRKAEFQLAIADRLVSSGILAAGMSHEINNPLGYIIANLEFACRETPSLVQKLRSLAEEPGAVSATPSALEELARDLDGIATALKDSQLGAERIHSITRDLRVLGDTRGEHDLPIDVRDVLDSAINLVWHETPCPCQLFRSYERVPLVKANTAKLTQVFLCLLSNAVYAIPEGDPSENEIHVSLRCDPDQRVAIAIRNTGPGMAPDVLRHVFDPFFTTKSPDRGRGLGLAISQKLVADLGGELRVESDPEKGSTFRVVLPAADADRDSSC
jgi:PAS domain S-box-containing protein